MESTYFKTLKRNNNSYYFTVPIETVRAMGLEEEDVLQINIKKVEVNTPTEDDDAQIIED